MARRTNLGLLLVLSSALLSGAVAQALGTPSLGRWMTISHGVAGISVLLLSPWKSAVVRRGLSQKNRRRTLSVLLAVQAVVVIATGVLHSSGWIESIGPFTVLWVHVAVALSMIPVAVWHVVARKTLPRSIDLTRRNFLRTAGLASTAAAVWWVADRSIAWSGLPGSNRRFTGSHERSSFDPDGLPVTSWIDDRVPSLQIDSWRLSVVDGDGRRSLSLAEIEALPADEVVAELDCTSGWYSRQTWTGVPLDHLVAPGETRSVVATSTTGYARRYPVDDLPNLWLVTRVGGQPLRPGHGFPARLMAPARRGFWWVKWVERLETSHLPWWIQSPYPLT
jgi:hypothetical protein